MYAIDHVNPTPVAEATVNERLAFLRRVYGWMAAALVATAFGAAISIESGLALATLQMGFVAQLVLVLAWIAIGWTAMQVRHRPVLNVVAYAGYALFTGYVISGLVLLAMVLAEASGSGAMTHVVQALVMTCATFIGLSLYAYTTRRDFSFLGGILLTSLIVLIVASLASFFIESTALALVTSSLGVLVFSGYVLYDTQNILRTYPMGEHVAASMTLFINFVLLFYHLLRLILLTSRD